MPLRNATCEALQQTMTIIDITKNRYDEAPDKISSPVGKHIRHIIDHLLAFQQGVQTGCIDYNVRHRDSELESNPTLASHTLQEFIQWLSAASLDQQNIEVISEISVSHCESLQLSSSIDRELIYLINHTLHHVALANVLARNMGIDTPEFLGIAPATATHLRESEKAEQLACAQ